MSMREFEPRGEYLARMGRLALSGFGAGMGVVAVATSAVALLAGDWENGVFAGLIGVAPLVAGVWGIRRNARL